MRVAYSDHSTNPVCGFGSAKSVLQGTNSTESNRFHHSLGWLTDLNVLLSCFREKMSDRDKHMQSLALWHLQGGFTAFGQKSCTVIPDGNAEFCTESGVMGQTCRTVQCSPFCPLFHFLWKIMCPHPVKLQPDTETAMKRQNSEDRTLNVQWMGSVAFLNLPLKMMSA